MPFLNQLMNGFCFVLFKDSSSETLVPSNVYVLHSLLQTFGNDQEDLQLLIFAGGNALAQVSLFASFFLKTERLD